MERRALRLGAAVFVTSATVIMATVWHASETSDGSGTRGVVGGVALLWALLTFGLAALAYVLGASRERAAAQAALAAERRAQDTLQRIAQQYQRVVEQVEQVIFQLDTEGRVTFLSLAWQTLTGHDLQSSMGHPLVGYLHPDDQSTAQMLCDELLECRRDECRQDLRLVTSGGTARWTAVHARPLIENGVVTGIAGTITDVTARRLAQQELEQARVTAEQASAAKSEFLKSMSHEMRTPLNGVVGLMELLAATELDEQQARYVAVVRASAAHLATLITDILDLARIEGGTLTLERTMFDLPDLVESSLDVVVGEAMFRRLRLSCTVTPDVPTWVVGDAGRLRQVLVSLLANAVKFTEQGAVHVQADAQVDLPSRKAMLRLEVQDTGPGLSADLVEHLFLPLDAPRLRRPSGTGLGLTVCKRLVEAMDGTIAVRSVEGGGATFSVVLPIAVADAAMVETERQGDAPLRVLAVLHDEAERAEIARLLEGWRFDAVVVGDCDAARDHVQAATPSRWPFGVVLLDGLATGAGVFARLLRDTVPEPGVVWITPEDGHVQGGISGMREPVVRPVKGPALFDAIMQAVVSVRRVASEGVKTPVWTRQLRVLVADDHDINQMVVREIVQAMGPTVDVVADGEQAVAAALAVPYDVILMDCQMPVLDGIEATRRIRRAMAERRTRHPPRIIALTANATADDRQACLDAGMEAYLTKPVRSAVLQRTLQRLLAGDTALEPAVDTGPEVPPAPAHSARAIASSPLEPVLGDTPDAEDILDPAEVLLRCNNNGDLGARMLELFAESLPSELEAIDAAAAAGDIDTVGRVAHKLRGAAATLAAVRLAGAVTGVELFLKHGDGGPLADILADVRHESALFLGVVPQIVRRLTETK